MFLCGFDSFALIISFDFSEDRSPMAFLWSNTCSLVLLQSRSQRS